MRLSRLLVIVLAVASRLPAQTAPTTTRLYGAYTSATPSTAAVVVTIQQPATVAARRQIQFEGAVLYCSVACSIGLEADGTAATATTGTTTKLDTRAPIAASGVFTGSDVGSGTVLNVYELAAGQQINVTKTGLLLGVDTGTRHNLTFRTNSISGTVHVLIMWSEPQ